jgi:SAM-dependent methyltransferase
VRARASYGFEFGQTLDALRAQRPGGLLRVVSVGDGGGFPSTLLVDENPDVRAFALELSLDALRHFFPKTTRFFRTPPDRIVRLHADALEMPFVDAGLDAVVGSAALHHFQLLTTFLKEANRVLRPGGFVHFTVELVWSSREPLTTSEEDILRTKGQYRRALEAAGFTAVEVGVGRHEIHRIAERTRLPYAFWWTMRPLVPLVRSITGEVNVSVRAMKPA